MVLIEAFGAASVFVIGTQASKCISAVFLEPEDTGVNVCTAAAARYVGEATCALGYSYYRHAQHVTVMGDALLVSRAPGDARAILSLRGAAVRRDDALISVRAPGGARLLRLWLSSLEEAEQWADALQSAAASSYGVLAPLRLTRARLAELKAYEGDGDERLRELEASLAWKNLELQEVRAELGALQERSKALSLTKRQMAEMEATSQAKERRLEELAEDWRQFKSRKSSRSGPGATPVTTPGPTPRSSALGLMLASLEKSV